MCIYPHTNVVLYSIRFTIIFLQYIFRNSKKIFLFVLFVLNRDLIIMYQNCKIDVFRWQCDQPFKYPWQLSWWKVQMQHLSLVYVSHADEGKWLTEDTE